MVGHGLKEVRLIRRFNCIVFDNFTASIGDLMVAN
jgi:hypothetical protein